MTGAIAGLDLRLRPRGWALRCFIPIVLAFLLVPRTAESGIAKEINIAFFGVSFERMTDKNSFVISEMANALLPLMIEKRINERNQIAWVEEIDQINADDPEVYEKTIGGLRESPFDLAILLAIRPRDFGHEVALNLVDRKLFSREDNRDLQVSERTVVRLNASFAEVEETLMALADRVARRMISGRTISPTPDGMVSPRGARILLSCIQADDPMDRPLETVGRRLTLELPYFISEAISQRGLPYEISGLSPEAYYENCFGPGSTPPKGKSAATVPLEHVDVVVDGWLSDLGGAVGLEVFVRTRERSYQVPLMRRKISESEIFEVGFKGPLGEGLGMDLATELVERLAEPDVLPLR